MLDNNSHAPTMGASAIIDTFTKLTNWNKQSPLSWDSLVINIQTIVRNNHSSQISTNEVIHKTLSDLENIVLAAIDYRKSIGQPDEKSSIIMYLPSYSAIPHLHKRAVNTTQQTLLDITDKLNQRHLKIDGKTPTIKTIHSTPCIFLKAGTNQLLPHQQLYGYIRDNASSGLLGNIKSMFGFAAFRVAMISHHPVDFHLATRVKNFSLIESFTGKVFTLKDLGQKVFKNTTIPFNSSTHLLFGDKIHIEPLAKRTLKKQLLTLSQTQRWQTLTEDSIVSRVVSTGQVPRTLLTQFKM